MGGAFGITQVFGKTADIGAGTKCAIAVAGDDESVYVRVVLATNGVSLVVDYVDVIRYLLGERAPLI